MELIQEITLLKESFLEFIIKVTPVFTESILDQFNLKWNPLKKLLSDPSKSASDVFIFVSSMSSLKKSNSSSTSATSPNSDCSIQQTNQVDNLVKKCNQLQEHKEITKVKEQANPLLYKELKIGNLFIKTQNRNQQEHIPKNSKIKTNIIQLNLNFSNNFIYFIKIQQKNKQKILIYQQQLDIGSNGEKIHEEDIKAKILKDDIKFLNQVRVYTPEKKVSVTVRCNLGLKLSEALSQFRKDNFTLKTIHEKSTEIMSPKSERSESPLILIQRPNHQYFQQPVFMQQKQAGVIKGYSIYSKKGYIQPIQFDVQFQMMIQQYQNNIVYRKLYF